MRACSLIAWSGSGAYVSRHCVYVYIYMVPVWTWLLYLLTHTYKNRVYRDERLRGVFVVIVVKLNTRGWQKNISIASTLSAQVITFAYLCSYTLQYLSKQNNDCSKNIELNFLEDSNKIKKKIVFDNNVNVKQFETKNFDKNGLITKVCFAIWFDVYCWCFCKCMVIMCPLVQQWNQDLET